jgi:hypothetical protein
MASDIETDGGESLKSVWAVSAEKDHTNGNPWRIYFTVPDVGGIEVK